jgi:hypothetical protein
MLKVLFGSWVGIMSITTIVLTLVVLGYWVGYCVVNASKSRPGK